MSRYLIVLTFVLFSFTTNAQDMNNTKLGEIISKEADSIQGGNGQWQIQYKDRLLICITDENANRMRIISPITELDKLEEVELKNVLVANFHTALDVKYAISDELLWSVFIHPLKELSELQLIDALSQVYYANKTFGLTYSSTTLVYPGNTRKKESTPKNKTKKI